MTAPVTPAQELAFADLRTHLPDRIWYLSENGTDMWCRRPYGFWFSSGQAAEVFASAMQQTQLFAVGVDTDSLLSPELLAGLSQLAVTRMFIDPMVDVDSGDVTGRIVRFQQVGAMQMGAASPMAEA